MIRITAWAIHVNMEESALVSLPARLAAIARKDSMVVAVRQRLMNVISALKGVGMEPLASTVFTVLAVSVLMAILGKTVAS